ncbi:MAG: response regulator [Chloroflexi bacterium]|nr:response regulator [Chloroflexota bacterium]
MVDRADPPPPVPPATGKRLNVVVGAARRPLNRAYRRARPHPPASSPERVEPRLGRQRLLTALNRLISSSLDMDDVLKAIAQAAATLMGAAVASFWVTDEESRTLELRAFSNEIVGAGQTFRKARYGVGSAGWVAEHRQPMQADNVFVDGRVGGLDWYRQHGLVSAYTTPVMSDDRVVAVLSLNGRQAFRFSPYDYSLLDGLVAQAAAAIRNARLFEAEAAASRAARAADRAKSEFLAMMSHEIRTPLNGILGSAELLATDQIAPDQHDLVQTIITSGELLLAIVNDVLDFGKIESGRMDFESLPFALGETIQTVVELNRAAAQARQLTLVTALAPTLPPLVVGDAGRLSQVLGNLVNNAVKFTETGEVRVQVGAQADGPAAVVLSVSVSDTGIGISPEIQRSLFQAFVQADSSTTRRFGGTGLGLAISKRLVELMGGEISVTSAPGEGSTFRFTVRLALPSAVPDSLLPATAPAGAVAGSSGPPDTSTDGLLRGRVLLVEDNFMNQRVVTMMLERLGYGLDIVDNGLAAIDAVSTRSPYDLILMDCHMPELDGFEATRRIRQLAVPGAKTPIVALTANAFPADRQRCLDAGMDDYMAKPISYEVFAQTVRHWLERT